jgi:hypothetical protein
VAVASSSASASPPPGAAAARRRGLREYVEAAGEMARRKDGGPPRWFSPLECAGGERVLGAPTLLYLPGMLLCTTISLEKIMRRLSLSDLSIFNFAI